MGLLKYSMVWRDQGRGKGSSGDSTRQRDSYPAKFSAPQTLNHIRWHGMRERGVEYTMVFETKGEALDQCGIQCIASVSQLRLVMWSCNKIYS